MGKRKHNRNDQAKERRLRDTAAVKRREAEAIERALDKGVEAAGEVTAYLSLLDLDLVHLDFRSRVMSLEADRDAAQMLWGDEEDDDIIDSDAADMPSPDGDSGE